MMHEEICTYEVCKLAKEKGFNVQTFDWYDYTGNYQKGFVPHKLHECPRYKEYYAPTQSLLQRWLREAHAIDIDVYPIFPAGEPCKREYGCQVYAVGKLNKPVRIGYAKTYENILESALKYALENMV